MFEIRLQSSISVIRVPPPHSSGLPSTRRPLIRRRLPWRNPTPITGQRLNAGVSPLYEISEGGIGNALSLTYLGVLLSVLLAGAFTVTQQVLRRIGMDESIKKIGDTIRTGDATSKDYFELGSILIRRKLYLQAIKNLEKAINLWTGPESDLAEVYNALGFANFRLEKIPLAIKNYKKAVELQPSYVVAWNNLGDIYESNGDWKEAFRAYQQSLEQESENLIAKERVEFLKGKLDRLDIKL